MFFASLKVKLPNMTDWHIVRDFDINTGVRNFLRSCVFFRTLLAVRSLENFTKTDRGRVLVDLYWPKRLIEETLY